MDAKARARVVEEDPLLDRAGVGLAKGLKLVEKLSHTVEAHYAGLEGSRGKTKWAQLYRLLDEVIALEQPTQDH
jgi:hypothetical protein